MTVLLLIVPLVLPSQPEFHRCRYWNRPWGPRCGFRFDPGSVADVKPAFQDKREEEDVIMKKTLKIEGMMCGHCKMRVEKALGAVDGVSSVEVNLEDGNRCRIPHASCI